MLVAWQKVIAVDAVKLAGVVVGEEHRELVTGIATDLEPAAEEARAADLLVPKNKSWHGYNTLGQAALGALKAALRKQKAADEPLAGRMVMIVGANATARALAGKIKEERGIIIVASHHRAKALELAQSLGSRHVQFEALYSTMHDILIVCDEEKEYNKGKTRAKETGIHAGYLRPGMTALDLTSGMRQSALLKEAAARGCHAVAPRDVLREQLAAQLHLLTGKQVPALVLEQPMLDMLEEEN